MINVSQHGLKESFYKGAKKLLERLLPNDGQTMNFKVFMIIMTGLGGDFSCCVYQIKWSHNSYLVYGTVISFCIILGMYLLHRNFQYDDISKVNYCVLWGLIALNEITSIILNYYMHGTKWPDQNSLFRFYTITIFIFSVYSLGALSCAIFGPIKKLTKKPIVYFEKISIILLVIGGIISFFVNLLWFVGIILVLFSVLREIIDYFKIILPKQITERAIFKKHILALDKQLLLMIFVSVIFKALVSLISLYSPFYRLVQPSFSTFTSIRSSGYVIVFELVKMLIIMFLIVLLRKVVERVLSDAGKQIEHALSKI